MFVLFYLGFYCFSMPNIKKKSKKIRNLTDFTIDDFANADSIRSRNKKGGDVMERIDWNWDDNVDDDIDLIEREDENGQKILVAHSSSRPDFDNVAYLQTSASEGNVYPLDVWFLISKFIAPEDVGTFARICRDSLTVTRSAEFWFHVYKKYFKTNPSIPLRLLPEQMKTRYSLRSCVIRTLYFTYPPFVTRTNAKVFHNFYSPKDLIKRKCLSLWYKKFKGQWLFYFKLKFINRSHHPTRSKPVLKRNVFEILDDIMANQELDCKILKVSCGSFSDAPPVMGLILNTIYTKVSSNMRHNRLYLGFNQSVQGQVSPVSDYSVILNNVVHIDVLDWWHPEYPYFEKVPMQSDTSDSDVPDNWFDD